MSEAANTTAPVVVTPAVQFGMPFISGFAYALDAHNGQVRKGSTVPYISHCLAVAALVLEFGGDEDLAIAGLLHDVIEDCAPVYAEKMQDNFGARVYSIVFQLTDGVPDANGDKPEWQPRKEAHLAKLRHASPDVLLVAACDKLHNATSLLADLLRDGLAAFDKFRGGMDGTVWYLSEMADITKRTPAGDALYCVVSDIELLVEMHRAGSIATA